MTCTEFRSFRGCDRLPSITELTAMLVHRNECKECAEDVKRTYSETTPEEKALFRQFNIENKLTEKVLEHLATDPEAVKTPQGIL